MQKKSALLGLDPYTQCIKPNQEYTKFTFLYKKNTLLRETPCV